MKRFLAFMFGLIFGVVFLLGAFGIAVYSSITVVHPNEVYVDIETYLGDLGDVSLLQAYYNILDLYNSKTGNLTNEDLYSIGDFLEDNNISSTDADGNTMAFGVVMPKELLDAPLFEYFNTNVDANGNTGLQRALKQIKLSAVPSIVNTFATPNESGELVVSQEVVAKLDNHSVYDLVYGQNQVEGAPNIVGNLAVVLEDITLADLVPALRDTNQTDNILKNLLVAVGQAPIGKLIGDLTGDQNILGMLNEDGALAAVGQLTVADILGDSDPLIGSLVGNIKFADIVNENGDLAIVDALDNISIAGLMGIVTRQADVTIPQENITSYYQIKDDGSNGPLVWSVGAHNGNYYISFNAENDSVATTWYEAQLICQNAHQHEANCYNYMWYAACKEEHDHSGEYVVGQGESAVYYQPVATTSLNYTIAQLKLSCLFDESGAINLNNLIAQFDSHSVEQILNELLAHNDILDKISQLLELDKTTLSDILADGGLDQLLANLSDKPIGEILQTFGVSGIDFVTDIIGDMSINQLVAGGYNNITVGTLIGLVKRDVTQQIADQNGQLDASVEVVNFTTTTEEGTFVELSVGCDNAGNYYISTNYDANNATQAIWYEGQLDCQDDTHTSLEQHTKQCFTYVLYQACTNENVAHNHATEDAFGITTTVEEVNTTTYYVKATGLFATLGNMTIGDIVNGGFNTLFDELLTMRLADLFDMLGVGEMEGILETLAQFTIKELMEGGYTSLSLGDLLGYKRYQNASQINDGSIVTFKDTNDNIVGYLASTGEQTVLSADGQKWYNAKLTCTQAHQHSFDCYEYLWYLACPEGCVEAHEHVTIDTRPHTLATGVFSILVDMTIGDITNNPNNIIDKLFEIQLKDILGDDLEGLMATIGQFSIKDLMDPTTLDSIGIGDILNYTRKDITNQVEGSNLWEDVVVETSAVVKHNQGTYAYFDETNSKWYHAQLHCKQSHLHQADCFGYIWYEKCTTAGCTNHKHHFELDATNYGSVEGMYGILADLTIGSLTGGQDIMETLTNRLTLGDIFGENIPEMLGSLKDTPIAELSGAIETTKVGNLLGYTYNESLARWEKDGAPLEGIEKVLADKTITDLKDFGSILDEVTLGDVLDPIPDMLKALANTKIADLGTAIETLYVGDLLGYTYNEGLARWEKDGTPLEGIEKVLAGKTVNDLKDFGSILDEVTLGDVLDPVPDMLGKLADTPITKIGEKIDTLVVGDFLGYSYLAVDVSNANWSAVVGVDGLYQHTDGTFALENNGVAYIAELTCEQTHQHDASCYQYKWYTKCGDGCTGATHSSQTHLADKDNNYFVEVTGITAKLAGKTISQLSNLGDLVNDLTLTDVFGQGNVPSMLQAIANEKISNLQTALNTIYVGDFLGYTKGAPNGEQTLVCTNSAHSTGDHTTECYIQRYNWWQLGCSNSAHNHSLDATPECYQLVEGITGKIANERLDTLSNIGETIKSFTLRDVLGDDIPGMLKGIADTPIGQLDSALDSLYLGEILQYSKHQASQATMDGCTTIVVDGFVKTNGTDYIICDNDVWYDAVVSCTTTDCAHTMANCYGYLWYDGQNPATGITAKLANQRVSDLGNLGDTIQTFTLYDVLGDNVPAMLESIKFEPINNLSNSINNVYVGEFLGYTKGAPNGNQTLDCDQAHAHTSNCYYDNYNWLDGSTPVDGMMAKIANKKVGNLGTIANDITSFTFAEIMGRNEGDNAIIKELYDTPVGDIGSKMNDIKLGTAMGYYRKEIATGVYQTDANGNDVWYTDSTFTAVVGAPQSAFVNSTLQNIGGDISNITLGQLIEIDQNSSQMIVALKDTPINNIAGAIDGMALGTSMGFVRREMDDATYTTEVLSKLGNVVVKTDGTNFVRLHDGKWYQAVYSCNQTHDEKHQLGESCYGFVWYEKCTESHQHQEEIVIDGQQYKAVGGLNAKMSNLTIGSMGGQAVIDIVTGLSMKDMIDSGILKFTEDDKFKLSLLFGCTDGSHNVTFLGQSFACNISGYFAYNAALATMGRPTVEVDAYYKQAHGIETSATLTSEQLAHRDLWQNCTLTQFIETLLGNF